MSKMEETEIRDALQELPEWSHDGKVIARRFRFVSFVEAVNFVASVAEISEKRNHHPFISIDYKVVTLRLTSWHAGGLTVQDFVEAREFDDLYESFVGNESSQGLH